MPRRHWNADDLIPKMTSVVPGVIYIFNLKTRSNEYSNRSLADLLGYSSEEIEEMGDSLFPNLCHPDDLPKVGAHFEAMQSLGDGKVLSIEYRMRHKAGQWVWLLSHDTIYERDTDGSALRQIGLATDITVQKRTETQIAAARDELETVFNAATSGIIALDQEGRIVQGNEEGLRFLGLSDAPRGGAPIFWPEDVRFLDPETMKPLEASASPILRALSGHDLHGETHLMRAGGVGEQARYVRISNARPRGDSAGISTVLNLDDITEEVRDRQVIERRGRLDALGQLTGGIAHDFNNLLGAMLYAVDLAGKAQTVEDRARYLKAATQSIERGSGVAKRLLAFARRQPGLATVRATQEILDEFRGLVRPVLEAQIEIAFEVSDPDLHHFCDQAQLETALMNLVLNARDAILHSGKGGHIRIKARAVASKTSAGADPEDGAEDDQGTVLRYVEFSVSDDGPGMDEDTLARCADPFFTTRGVGSGTGLGLAIVYGFITQSDGALRISSEEGLGTTVRMTLPRGTAQGGRELAVPAELRQMGKGERILVVEDDFMLLGPMTELLGTLNYEVITASSGQQALERIEAGLELDLLLTDVVMPGKIGGFDLARAARKLRPDLPVIYMSGYTGYTASEMGEVTAPLLQKPAPVDDLARVIGQALQSERPSG